MIVKRINQLILALMLVAVLGIATSAYLAYHHYFGSRFCNINEFISCDKVSSSEYSVILGMPLAVLGILYFLSVLIMSVISRRYVKILLYVFYLTLPILVYSIFLTFIEFYVINALCIFCEFTKVLMIAIMLITFAILRNNRLL